MYHVRPACEPTDRLKYPVLTPRFFSCDTTSVSSTPLPYLLSLFIMAYTTDFMPQSSTLTSTDVSFMNGDNANGQPDVQVDPITSQGFASRPDPTRAPLVRGTPPSIAPGKPTVRALLHPEFPTVYATIVRILFILLGEAQRRSDLIGHFIDRTPMDYVRTAKRNLLLTQLIHGLESVELLILNVQRTTVWTPDLGNYLVTPDCMATLQDLMRDIETATDRLNPAYWIFQLEYTRCRTDHATLVPQTESTIHAAACYHQGWSMDGLDFSGTPPPLVAQVKLFLDDPAPFRSGTVWLHSLNRVHPADQLVLIHKGQPCRHIDAILHPRAEAPPRQRNRPAAQQDAAQGPPQPLQNATNHWDRYQQPRHGDGRAPPAKKRRTRRGGRKDRRRQPASQPAAAYDPAYPGYDGRRQPPANHPQAGPARQPDYQPGPPRHSNYPPAGPPPSAANKSSYGSS